MKILMHFSVNVNETIEKHTDILKTDKPGENKLSGTIALQKEIEKLQLQLRLSQKRNWNLKSRQKQNSKWKNNSRSEIRDRKF